MIIYIIIYGLLSDSRAQDEGPRRAWKGQRCSLMTRWWKLWPSPKDMAAAKKDFSIQQRVCEPIVNRGLESLRRIHFFRALKELWSVPWVKLLQGTGMLWKQVIVTISNPNFEEWI